MRFLGLIITLAVVGYAIHLYLGDSPGAGTEAEPMIDQSSEAVDAMNRALQQHQQTLDRAN
jgi:hypothetical protein